MYNGINKYCSLNINQQNNYFLLAYIKLLQQQDKGEEELQTLIKVLDI